MKPTVVINQDVYQKIMHWVNKSNDEVSGLGKVVIENGRYRVVDAMLLPQKNGSTHTDIEGEAVGKAMYELRETEGHLNFWWHSHVNMSVFWSGTDMDTIKKIGEGGWFLSTVFNKRYEMRSALYVNNAFANPGLFADQAIFLDELDTKIVNEIADEVIAQWDREYDQNVESVRKVFHKGSTTEQTSGTDSAGRAWKKKKKKKWQEAQGELTDTRVICEGCLKFTCICDEDDLGPISPSEIKLAFDSDEITAEEAAMLYDRWDKMMGRADDDGPTLNRHAPAPKAGPGANGNFPKGVY